ncbi:MAG TPA: DUF4349 domain-containing protein [Mycobacteriales bacterium]|nr:DUF4349 domain-containing protein [Mycobacteriales bacterium]
MRRLLLLPVLALALTACTGSSDDASTASGAESGAAADMAAPEAVADSAGGGGGTTTAGALPPLASLALAGEAVVRTAELDVRVDDVRPAADRAAAVARDAGGAVVSERADLARGGVAGAELVLRVPPEQLDGVLTALAGLGEERGRVVSSEEVGEELVDLEARLATQRASVDRVRALLEEADDLAQVVQVEGELTRRTADLESLQARLTALRDRVRLSTVTLRLDAEDGPGTAAGGLPGFLDGLRGGWAALLAAGTVLAATAGALLPFLPVALLLGWAALRARRRRGALAA